jgi:hypothetical protein
MHIDKVRIRRFLIDAKLAIMVALIMNAILTAWVLKYAGGEVLWTLGNKGMVDREIVRVNKLSIEGRVASPVPFE